MSLNYATLKPTAYPDYRWKLSGGRQSVRGRVRIERCGNRPGVKGWGPIPMGLRGENLVKRGNHGWGFVTANFFVANF